MVKKIKKVISIYPEENKDSIEYQSVLATKNEERFKIEIVQRFAASAMEDILKQTKADLVVGVVPSQNYFQKVINFPPVETKRIPEIVQFEAVQQILFNINEVYWGWKSLTDYPKDPELKVKIAAVKKDTVEKYFPFKKVNFITSTADVIPSLHQKPGDEKLEGILAIDKTATDIVICKNGDNYWNRIILIGNENDSASEDGKSDLVTEVKRSLGFWNTSHPDEKIPYLLCPNTNVSADKLHQISKETGIDIRLGHAYNKFENPSAITGNYLYAAAGVLASENVINLIESRRYKFKRMRIPRKPREPFIWTIGKFIENFGKSFQK